MSQSGSVNTYIYDQRGSALGALGLEAVQTPNLDRLAARGVSFTRAPHFGSYHGAVCAPSRFMLHSGQPYFGWDGDFLGNTYLMREDRSLAPPETLGQKLQRLGYDCFATGKWHNGIEMFYASFNCGTDIFLGGMADLWFTPVHDFDPSGRYPRERARTAGGFSTEVFARAAMRFWNRVAPTMRPFSATCRLLRRTIHPHRPTPGGEAIRPRRYLNCRTSAQLCRSNTGSNPPATNACWAIQETPATCVERRRNITE